MSRSFNVDDLIRSYDSDEKNKSKRYREFLYHCFTKFEKEIKKIKSKKMINRYITMRNNTLSHLIQNEKEITLKLSKLNLFLNSLNPQQSNRQLVWG